MRAIVAMGVIVANSSSSRRSSITLSLFFVLYRVLGDFHQKAARPEPTVHWVERCAADQGRSNADVWLGEGNCASTKSAPPLPPPMLLPPPWAPTRLGGNR